ncbi:MAG: hypothetical protein AB1Y25_05855 [Cycloclasticus sp.]
MVNLDVVAKVVELYGDLFAHEGFGEIRIEVNILRRGQKEVIIHCGKQYRYVVDAKEQGYQDFLNDLQGLRQSLLKRSSLTD